MADIVIAYIVMAYIVMAYVVMAYMIRDLGLKRQFNTAVQTYYIVPIHRDVYRHANILVKACVCRHMCVGMYMDMCSETFACYRHADCFAYRHVHSTCE